MYKFSRRFLIKSDSLSNVCIIVYQYFKYLFGKMKIFENHHFTEKLVKMSKFFIFRVSLISDVLLTYFTTIVNDFFLVT